MTRLGAGISVNTGKEGCFAFAWADKSAAFRLGKNNLGRLSLPMNEKLPIGRTYGVRIYGQTAKKLSGSGKAFRKVFLFDGCVRR